MAIPGVDIVVGTQDRTKLLGYIEQYRAERQPINAVRNIMKTEYTKNWMYLPLQTVHVLH